MRQHPVLLTAVCLGFELLASCGPGDEQRPPRENGELTLAVLDAATGDPVSARVELLDEAGAGHVAGDALPILRMVQPSRSQPAMDHQFEVSRRFPHPQSGTDQFYSTGSSTLSLPPGEYRLRIWKGLEYEAVDTTLQIASGEEVRLELRLSRWIDMPRSGWYGADDHIHLPRPTPDSNAALLQWMAAEDIHIANLLQMGSAKRFDFAPQYAHGEAGRFGLGHHLLISGQENPRTHFLGHTIILGTDRPIQIPAANYLDFRRFFEEGHRQGALNGFAHFGHYGGAQSGLSFVLPHDLLDFLEILQFERGHYDVWYKVLDSGFRLTPTAGSDYPWGRSYPGRERFYTRVPGRFTVARWIESVRAGHTFVTNGPMLNFRVNGKIMGETVRIPEPGTVEVVARVSFDRHRDNVMELELVDNGVVARSFPRGRPGSTNIVARFRHDVRRSGWLAVRASGQKSRQAPARQSLAHSAPIFVEVEGTTPLAEGEEARRLSRSWIALLDDLEEALADENLDRLSRRMGSARVDLPTIVENRPGLLKAIREARDHFREQSR